VLCRYTDLRGLDDRAEVVSAELTTARERAPGGFSSALSASMASTSTSPRTTQPFQTFTGKYANDSPIVPEDFEKYNKKIRKNIFQQIQPHKNLFCPTSEEGNKETPFYYVVTTGISMHGGRDFSKGQLMQEAGDQSIFIQLAPFGKVTYSECNLETENMVKTFFDGLYQQSNANDGEKLRFLKDPLESIESISQTRSLQDSVIAKQKDYQKTYKTNRKRDTHFNIISQPKYQRIHKQMKVYNKDYGIGEPEMIDHEIKDTGYIYVQINAYPQGKDALLCSILIKFAINNPEFEITRFGLVNAIRSAILKAHLTWRINPNFKITNIFADFTCSRGSYDRDDETGLGRKTKKLKKRKNTKKRRKTKKKQRKTKKTKKTEIERNKYE
jgi:hypothetical protein